MGISTFPAATAGGLTEKVLRYTTAGTDTTFTLPSGYGVGNPLMADVTILGGGGAGGCGNYSSATNWGFGGGGGAGGFFQGVIPLTQNMTVRVGRGGAFRSVSGTNSEASFGGNGGASYIGTGTIKNMFINPAFYGHSGQASKVCPPFTMWDYTADSGIGQATTGAQLIYISASNWSNGAQGYGQAYPVKASTNYCFSIYLKSSGGAVSARVIIDWLDVNGSLLSSVNGTTASTSTTVWNRYSVTGTAPSNAAYIRPRINGVSGVNLCYANSPMLEENATTPGTYVDGGTTGYKYIGTPFGSPTILASDTMYAVNGGGGGAGINSNMTVPDFCSGFAGGCSGGGAIRIGTDWSTQNVHVYAGNGGGLGGNAGVPNYGINATASPADIIQMISPRSSQYADHSFGSNGFTARSSALFYANSGSPGPSNSFGYGKGGSGSLLAAISSNSANNFTYVDNIANLIETYKNPKPNSGDGGDSITTGVGNGSKIQIGGAGGSGLVIIRYWS